MTPRCPWAVKRARIDRLVVWCAVALSLCVRKRASYTRFIGQNEMQSERISLNKHLTS